MKTHDPPVLVLRAQEHLDLPAVDLLPQIRERLGRQSLRRTTKVSGFGSVDTRYADVDCLVAQS